MYMQDACFLMTSLNNNNEDPQIEKWFSHATYFNTYAYTSIRLFFSSTARSAKELL